MNLNLFRKKPVEAIDRKESRASAAMVLTPNQAVWSKRDYAAFAREAYGQNVVAARCISSIAEAIASLRLLAYRGEQELEDHPALNVLRNPNPKQSGRDFLEEFVSYFLIAGNEYAEGFTVGGEIREVYNLRPDRVSIVPAVDGSVARYEYKVGGRKVVYDATEDPSPILHFKTFNPTDDWYGLSPVESGAYAIDQHNQAMAHTQALLQNSATPSGALVTEQELPDDQFARLKSEMEEQYQGARNAGRPMLLEGGLDWKAMGFSPSDMEVIETMNSAARNICLAFGVPPMLIGIPGDNTYSNYSEARLAFWEDTVIPLADRVFMALSQWLSDDVQIKPDYDQVPAIVDKRKTLSELLQGADYLTDNEKREAMGYAPITGGDELRRSEAPQPPIDAKTMGIIAGYDVPRLREVK